MYSSDLHVHSTFSDGKNTVEEIILSAIDMGLTQIGISDHSYTWFDESYCMKKTSIEDYRSNLLELKEKYSDKIKVKIGIEQDYYSEESTTQYDYVIGSVHYIKVENEFVPVDESPEILIDAVNEYFNGDIYALIEEYYKTVSDVAEKTNADIIGHFDLITKFNENSKLFDENNDRYVTAYKRAADKLLQSEAIFEINTGAISRGYRSTPYPSVGIYKYLNENGARFVLSSDSHSKDTLCYSFEKFYNMM